MVINESIGNEPVTFESQPITAEPQQVALSAIFVQPEEYSFRNKDEFDDGNLKDMKVDVVKNGIITPLLIQHRGKNRYVAIDGHGRLWCLKSLVEDGVDGFSADMLVPANVIPSTASELATTAFAVSANVQRRSFSAEGRIRATARLDKLGMPQAEIARRLNVSEATISRDLALAGIRSPTSLHNRCNTCHWFSELLLKARRIFFLETARLGAMRFVHRTGHDRRYIAGPLVSHQSTSSVRSSRDLPMPRK